MDYVTNRRQLISKHGFAVSKTSGSSMRPLIWGGQHSVIVTPLSGSPRVGDILMFAEPAAGMVSAEPSAGKLASQHRLIVHRIVSECPDGYITRGDNCLKTETVAHSQIIGVVTEIHRLTPYRPWHAVPLARFSVSHPWYRIYSRVWLWSWPARRVVYMLRGVVTNKAKAR